MKNGTKDGDQITEVTVEVTSVDPSGGEVSGTNALLPRLHEVVAEDKGMGVADSFIEVVSSSIANRELFDLMPEHSQVDVVNNTLIAELHHHKDTLDLREWLISTSSTDEYVDILKSHCLDGLIEKGVI